MTSDVGFIERYVDLEPLTDGHELLAVGLGARFRLAGCPLMRRLLIEFLRSEPGVEHGMARLFDERRHVDTHRANQAATTTHIAAVEQQMLPMLQLIRGDLALQTKQFVERREGARLALVGLLERLNLPDWCVLRIFGRNVEMTGVSTNTAVNAGLEPEGTERTDFLCEAAHGAGNASLRSSSLRRREIGGEYARVIAHEVAPLRASRAPLMAREGKR